jgi:hypothetical protein
MSPKVALSVATDEFLVRTGEKSRRQADFSWQTCLNHRKTRGTVLGQWEGMTDAVRHKLSLLLALVGVMMMLGCLSGNLWLGSVSRNMPAFEKSSPEIPDWPNHHPWNPVG